MYKLLIIMPISAKKSYCLGIAMGQWNFFPGSIKQKKPPERTSGGFFVYGFISSYLFATRTHEAWGPLSPNVSP